MKSINCTLWPEQEKQKYCRKGYWQNCSSGQLLRQWAASYGTKTALVDGDIRLSYQELDQKVDRLVAGFYRLGIKSGDRVILQMPNSNNFVLVFFALLRLGAMPVLTLPAQRENDVAALCALSEPVAYISANSHLGFNYLNLAKKLQQKFTSLKHVIVDGESAGFISLADLDSSPIILPDPDAFEPALLLLSGGTTGTPKLIPRTHADYAFNARASAQLCQLDDSTVYLAALPIAHNFPLACPGILGTLSVGGTVIMARTPGNDEAFSLIEREKVTMTSLVPPLVQLWLSARDWDKTNISSLQLLQVGGSRFEPELAKQVSPVLGCQLQQVFGMAEGLLCYTRLDDPEEVVINTQGRPLCDDDEIRVVDSDGVSVAQGEVGELHTRGPYTLRGYYQAEQHNSTAFTDDGFYKSGDLVRLTDLGNIVVEGRIKEQINRAGEKIAVAEIEQQLTQHPAISSCALIPVPDEGLGERSCAFIIEHKSVSLQNIQQYFNSKGIPRYKWPDQLEKLESWPLTAVGKIDKKRLLNLAVTQPLPIARYAEHRIKVEANSLELALQVIESGLTDEYAIYEHNEEWSIGMGRYATITADSQQAQLCIHHHANSQFTQFQKSRLCESIAAATEQIPVADWRAYGAAKFELSHVFFDLEFAKNKEKESLLELFIPNFEVRIKQGEVLLRAIDANQLTALIKRVQELDKQCCAKPRFKGYEVKVDIRAPQYSDYLRNVQSAVHEIAAGKYQKVILSRRIPLHSDVDLIESYHNGRLQNTPARSFLVNYGDSILAGFSPETVVEVSANGHISTQPLAGTRALGEDSIEEKKLRDELLGDNKEIAEHAVSVKLSQEELRDICDDNSIAISEFMAVRRRGSVQHLASRVTGKLLPGKNAWDAFESLFPAVTASGIPKKESIDAIVRFEKEPRGWYSGSVMIVDSDGAMDAALVLRSIYQQGEKIWLQAGAGVIAQSKPERELEETIEKLSCISQHLRSKVTSKNKKSKAVVACQ